MKYKPYTSFCYKFPLRHRLRHPIERLHEIGLNIKYAYQRIKYGWCEKDTFDIDTWFLNVIPQMLKYFRDNFHSHPVFMLDNGELDPDSEHSWNMILDEMISCFDAINNDILNIHNSNDKYKDRAFELLSKHFWNLWD